MALPREPSGLDPLFAPGDPLAMGGYAYADNNPRHQHRPHRNTSAGTSTITVTV